MCNWSMCTAAVLRDFDDDYIRREAQAPSPSFSFLGCHWHCPVRANDGPPLPPPPLIEISLRRGSLSFFEVENHFLICDSLVVVVCNEWVSGRFLSRALEDRVLYIGGRLMSLMNDRLIHKNKVQPSYNLMTEWQLLPSRGGGGHTVKDRIRLCSMDSSKLLLLSLLLLFWLLLFMAQNWVTEEHSVKVVQVERLPLSYRTTVSNGPILCLQHYSLLAAGSHSESAAEL